MQGTTHIHTSAKGLLLALACALALALSGTLAVLVPAEAYAAQGEVEAATDLGIKIRSTAPAGVDTDNTVSSANGTVEATTTLGLKVVNSAPAGVDPDNIDVVNPDRGIIEATTTLGLKVTRLDYSPQSFDVAFVTNNDQRVNARAVNEGDLVDEPSGLAVPGYTLTGWYTDAALTQPWDFAADKVSAPMTLYAKWEANTNTSYVVRHYQQNVDGNQYTLFETENLTGTTDTAIAAFDKGYTGFTKASQSGDTTIKGDGSSVVDVKYDRNTYQVTAEAGTGATITGGTGTFRYGASTTIQWGFDDGYELDSVTDNGVAVTEGLVGNSLTLSDIAGAHAVVVTAKESPKQTFTVTFDHNYSGAPQPSTATVNEGDSVARGDIPTPTREGYIFEGWHEGSTESGTLVLEENAFDFNTAVTADKTLYAKWDAIEYTINYYRYTTGSDTVKAAETKRPEDSVVLPGPSEVGNNGVAGHKLSGWYALADSKKPTAAALDAADPQNAYADSKVENATGGEDAVAGISVLGLAEKVGAKRGLASDAEGAQPVINLYAAWTPVYNVTTTLSDIATRNIVLKRGENDIVAPDPLKFTSHTSRTVEISATSHLDMSDAGLQSALGVSPDALNATGNETVFKYVKPGDTAGAADSVRFPVNGEAIGATPIGSAPPNGELQGNLMLHLGSNTLVTLEVRDWQLATVSWTAAISADGVGSDTGSWLYADAAASVIAAPAQA